MLCYKPRAVDCSRLANLMTYKT